MIKVTSFLLFITLLFSSHLKAQQWLWAKCSSGVSSSVAVTEGADVAVDSKGNVYLDGDFGFDTATVTFGSYTLNCYGYLNFFLVKYDDTGNVKWAKDASEQNCYAIGLSVAVDNEGNVYASGLFSSPTIIFGSDTLFNESQNNSNFFLVKYDSLGNVLWAKSADLGSSSLNIVTTLGIAIDPLNNVYITGHFKGDSVSLNSVMLHFFGGFSDVFLAKYNSSGDLLWAKSAGGVDDDEGKAITIDPSGNIFLTGGYGSPINFDGNFLTSPDQYGSFLASYDSNGNFLWAKNVADSPVVSTWKISHDNSHHIYVVGEFVDTTIVAGDTLRSHGNNDMFLAKYDDLGNAIWGRSAGGEDYDGAHNVTVDAEDNVYVIGEYFSLLFQIGTDTVIGYGGIPDHDPMFIAKYDRDGNVSCITTLISGADDYVGIAATLNDAIVIGGDFYHANPFIVGSDTLIQTSEEDAFVAKWTCDYVGIPETSNDRHLEIFPNPVQNLLTIDLGNQITNPIISVYDLQGRRMECKILSAGNENSIQLNTENLSDGFYTLQITDKNSGKTSFAKFVKDS